MDKEQAKAMLSKAIDNIPDCAQVTECVVCHAPGASDASIVIQVQMFSNLIEDDPTRDKFHEIAHNSFGTDMLLAI